MRAATMKIVIPAVLVFASSTTSSAFTVQFGQHQKSRACSFGTCLFAGDGNPPPFGNWSPPPPAAPETTSAPAPVPYDYSSWGQPAATAETPAPAPEPVAPATTTSASSVTAVAGGDPIETLSLSQQAVVDRIVEAMPDLELKPDFCFEKQPMAGSTASIEARDAPGASNVAWFSNLCVDGKISSLTIFNGPLTDVPHILSRCCMTETGELELVLDARPRAYGAYETVNEEGVYPGPETLGRKAFEYSGARNDFFGKYGTDEIKALLDPNQFEGATSLPQTELDQLTGGPLALAVRMPASDANVAKVAQTRERLATAWLEWTTTAEPHRPGAPVNTQYVYDAKFRQNAYSALLPYYNTLLGQADGAELAVAESGPLDEAYVGGAS